MKNYSIDLTRDELETVQLGLLLVHEQAKDENRKRRIGALIDRVWATPAFDNPIVFGHRDLMNMISSAINFVSIGPSRMRISNKDLVQHEISKIALARSVLMWLNSENNLKRSVEFDFTDDTEDFESHDDLT